MIKVDSSDERRVVPRWRAFDQVVANNGMQFSRAKDNISENIFLPEKRAIWRRSPDLDSATDLLTSLVTSDLASSEEAQSLIKYINQNISEESLLFGALNHSDMDIHQQTTQDLNEKTSLIKKLLRFNPHSALDWIELARLYTINGQASTQNNNKANRAIQTALQLAPNHRYVLRAACRFYIHFCEFDKASYILAKSPRTNQDPWLASSLISVSQISESSLGKVKRLRALSEDENWPLFSRSELLASLGTQDSNDGAHKKAKKKFIKVIESPTENALAQAQWMFKTKRLNIDISQPLNSNPLAHEARLSAYYEKGKWKKMFDCAVSWHEDEEYSSRPIRFGSYVSVSILENYREGLELLYKGHKSNPDEFNILNNMIICHSRLNENVKATDILDRVKLHKIAQDSNQIATIQATEGLVNFRSGKYNEGRKKYIEALDSFRNDKSIWEEIVCNLYFSSEESNAGYKDNAKKIYSETEKLIIQNKITGSDIKALRQLVKSKL